MNCCFTNIKPLCVSPKFFYIFFRYFLIADAFFVCSFYDFIVNIRKILNKCNVISAVFEVSAKNIKHAQGARVADVYIVIYGRAAGVYFYFAFFECFKLFFFSCKSVENFHFFISSSCFFNLSI